MDWPRENVRINEKDLEKVYKYEPKPCSVVRMLNTDEVFYKDLTSHRYFDLTSDRNPCAPH